MDSCLNTSGVVITQMGCPDCITSDEPGHDNGKQRYGYEPVTQECLEHRSLFLKIATFTSSIKKGPMVDRDEEIILA